MGRCNAGIAVRQSKVMLVDMLKGVSVLVHC